MKKEKRILHIPRMYRHFKGEKYIALFTATYIDRAEYNKQLFDASVDAIHTEVGDKVACVLGKDGKYRYTYFDDQGELIIYICISGKNLGRIYARPIKMFAEKVDVKKYPNENQLYRFEKKLNKIVEVEI